MDPIIRSAPVSAVAREIGRPRPSLVAAVAAQPAATRPPAPTAPAAPSAAELKLQTALRERDAELADLRAQGEKIKADLAAIHAEAEKKGYEAGASKGEKAATQLLQGQIERVRALAVELGKTRDQVLHDAEDALVEIVHTSVCRIVGEQGAAPDTVARLVREAAAASRDGLAIRLHPADAALLRDGDDSFGEHVRLVADGGVKLGGCIVDSDSGSLDARFETQLELLGAALLQARAARAAHASSGDAA